ncbi:MarR family winged helix-turn-helix transcriptional regulator [Streptomyces coeruleorubidus]|uniref:MarR family winged helix-turn-helix transcriptional regulator n=1 Tax=Streptomyces coeruleorubidus TaxID=116188 RepID=UPI0036FC7B95
MRQDEEDPIAPDALNRVTWALRRVNWAVQAHKEQRLRARDIAAAQYTLLICVHTEPGLTGAEVARRLNVTPQAVASLVARLEERGQLERRPHARHRHVRELHLTDVGRDALRHADAVIVEIEQRIAEKLGHEKTAQLKALLGEVADVIDEV